MPITSVIIIGAAQIWPTQKYVRRNVERQRLRPLSHGKFNLCVSVRTDIIKSNWRRRSRKRTTCFLKLHTCILLARALSGRIDRHTCDRAYSQSASHCMHNMVVITLRRVQSSMMFTLGLNLSFSSRFLWDRLRLSRQRTFRSNQKNVNLRC